MVRSPTRRPPPPDGEPPGGEPPDGDRGKSLAHGRYPGQMHDPRVLLDPATDAVRKLARRGYSLDLTALEKLLAGRNSAIHRGDEARAEAKRVATAVKGADPGGRAELVARARELKAVVGAAEEESRALDAELTDLLLGIPNVPADE